MQPSDDTRAATASLAPSTEGAQSSTGPGSALIVPGSDSGAAAQAPKAPGASAGSQLEQPLPGCSTHQLVSPSARKWAVFDASGIWGAGDTPRQAFYEAKGFFEDKLPPRDPVLTQTICGFQVARIAPELLDIVIADGPGYVLFAHVDGELVPAAEPFGSGAPKVVRIRA